MSGFIAPAPKLPTTPRNSTNTIGGSSGGGNASLSLPISTSNAFASISPDASSSSGGGGGGGASSIITKKKKKKKTMGTTTNNSGDGVGVDGDSGITIKKKKKKKSSSSNKKGGMSSSSSRAAMAAADGDGFPGGGGEEFGKKSLPPDVYILGNKRRRKYFLKELPGMMYGFGDAENPSQESIELVDSLATDCIRRLAADSSELSGGRPTVESLLFLLRNDADKYERAMYLLGKEKQIAEARNIG